MIQPKPMFWILLMSVSMWYFLVVYPITTILTIVSMIIIGGILVKINERNK